MTRWMQHVMTVRHMFSQAIPRVIWQTWKDTKPGAKRFEGMNSMVQVGPDS